MPGPNDEVDTADDGGLPRWVKVSAMVAAVVIATLILVALLTGSGDHGPGRHVPQGSSADEAAGAAGPSLAVPEPR